MKSKYILSVYIFIIYANRKEKKKHCIITLLGLLIFFLF